MELEKTYEIIEDITTLEMQSETASHFIFYCPFCILKAGKEDKDGKLWWSKEKNVSWCFRCHTVGFLSTSEDETGETDLKLNRLVDKTSENLLGISYKDPYSLGFDFNDLTVQDKSYLKSRHPFLPLLAPYLGIKSWKGSTKGIVVPYIFKNYAASFQVRFYDIKEGQRKAYLPKDVPKLLYSPQHILNNFKLIQSETITIVEGWADAVAAMCMGYPNPVSIQGSHITDYQYFLFRRLMPANAFIIMDDFDISRTVQKDLKSKIPSLSESKIVSFGKNVDPEEHLKKQIQDKEKFNLYLKNTRDIILRFKNEI